MGVRWKKAAFSGQQSAKTKCQERNAGAQRKEFKNEVEIFDFESGVIGVWV